MILYNNGIISGYRFTDLYKLSEDIIVEQNCRAIFDYKHFLVSISNIEIFMNHSADDNASIAILRNYDTCELFKYLKYNISEILQFGDFYRLHINNEPYPYVFNGDELDIHMFILSEPGLKLFENYEDITNKYSIEQI